MRRKGTEVQVKKVKISELGEAECKHNTPPQGGEKSAKAKSCAHYSRRNSTKACL